jgi:hypothetical protein
MTIETDEQLLARIEEKQKANVYFMSADSADDRGGHDPNHDPTANPKYQKKPHCIYFFYMRYNSDNRLYVTHYFYDHKAPIAHNELKTHVKRLALNARPLSATRQKRDPLPLPDGNFQDIWIKRVAHFVVFMDEVHWEFFQSDGKPKVEFKKTDPNGNACDPNYSFFKAHVLDIAMPKDTGGEDNRQALCMLHLMKRNKAGDELQDEEVQKWWFDMYKRVSFASADRYDEQGVAIETNLPPHKVRKLTIIADPGGTNLGPPIPPPD